MGDRAGVSGLDAMSVRGAREAAADRTAQALHEAHYARIRAGALDAAGAYDEGRISWERAYDAAERATAWQQIHDHWCVVPHGRVPAPRRAPDDVRYPPLFLIHGEHPTRPSPSVATRAKTT